MGVKILIDRIFAYMGKNIDKIVHFWIWYGVTLTALLFRGTTFGLSVGISTAVLKEVWDYIRYGRNYDFTDFAKMALGDLAADALGILCAFMIYTLIGGL